MPEKQPAKAKHKRSPLSLGKRSAAIMRLKKFKKKAPWPHIIKKVHQIVTSPKRPAMERRSDAQPSNSSSLGCVATVPVGPCPHSVTSPVGVKYWLFETSMESHAAPTSVPVITTRLL